MPSSLHGGTGLDQDYGREAAENFQEKVWGKKLSMQMISHDKRTNTLNVILTDPSSQDGDAGAVSINQQMVKDGFAMPQQLPRRAPAHVAAVFEALQAGRNDAHKKHRGMFEYGDPTGNDDFY